MFAKGGRGGGLNPIFGNFTVRKFIKFPGGGGPDLDPLPPNLDPRINGANLKFCAVYVFKFIVYTENYI